MSHPEGFGEFETGHTVEAPIEKVYEAFMTTEGLAAWFGPAGWSVPAESVAIEPREGGAYRLTMVNDEDAEQSSPVTAVIDELRAPEYIRATDSAYAALGFPQDVVMETVLTRVEGGTSIVIRQAPLPLAVFEPASAGWASSFQKLDAHLSRQA
ncbi:SRPBCC domain-containing protein [Falsarthrobacter nasiphocae]|uniref:Uncharacterized protein YndB with AHSA1/START domain n=1 Tax=Falsarthrobacter nasiphocae TaxID=189863 RepID=A0AAE3YF78_9MICC|nr:SRPBCC domain-containing protein [Falsarthrobacter nasiphocae]MDR6892140.1 uncharacterized protein YndB with AHSA1/START domain [Falsarthrobacter nasiphocae]